jgi:hypothetical protein
MMVQGIIEEKPVNQKKKIYLNYGCYQKFIMNLWDFIWSLNSDNCI